MSEMIERVAKAIYEGRNGRGAIPFRHQLKTHQEAYLADARAAIEAMRTPTEAMIRDGHLLDPLGCDVDDEDAAMIYTRIWGAMLSAALSPSGGK